MSNPAQTKGPTSGGAGIPPDRPTHRSSVLRNVGTNWIVYFVVLVTGLVIPRLIDIKEGQELLGVWDFGWSLVAYVALLSLGVVSAVNRYVARYTAVQDWEGLNTAVNSALALFLGSFGIGVLLSLVFVALVPVLLHQADPANISVARWTIRLLTLAASMKLPIGAIEGVLTGHERYDLLNMVRAGREITSVVAMSWLLINGFGLEAIAALHLVAEIAAGGVKVAVVRRICPELRFAPSWVRRAMLVEMLGFGGKTLLQGFARTGLYQLNTILVAYFLGPIVLAVYSRQRALVLHAVRFLKKYSLVFVPTSGRLDAKGDTAGLQDLLMTTSRYGFHIALPIIALFLVMGGPLLEVWMGPVYKAPWILAVLALGHTLALPQESAYSILVGMGRHGYPSLIELVAAVCGVGLCAVALGALGGGMLSAALAVAIPVTVAGGLVAPWYACRLLRLSVWRYARAAMVAPVLAVLPFVVALLIARWAWPDSAFRALMYGVGAGGVVLAAVYWVWVVPPSLRAKVARIAGLRRLQTVPTSGRME
jgi:O-antigen/teichoic acid export membrane protein